MLLANEMENEEANVTKYEIGSKLLVTIRVHCETKF